MPKKAFLPKQVMRGLQRWHEDARHRLKIKTMEKYQTQRLARKAITPLDDQYFLRQSDVPGVLAITDGHTNSTPMNIIMEEGDNHGYAKLLPSPQDDSLINKELLLMECLVLDSDYRSRTSGGAWKLRPTQTQ